MVKAGQLRTQPKPVQSVARSLELLEHLADAGGTEGLTQLAARSGLPLPTIHRLLQTLLQGGYVSRERSRQYTLGPRLIRLGEVAGRSLGRVLKPRLARLAIATGETANLAALDGDEMVYVAQAPSPHPMRMFMEVGRRVSLHDTGVGKAMLSRMTDVEVMAIIGRTGMRGQTARAITDPLLLLKDLEAVRLRGYALDDEEHEVGVRCVAVPLELEPSQFAISISGPRARLDDDSIRQVASVLMEEATMISAWLNARSAEFSLSLARSHGAVERGHE